MRDLGMQEFVDSLDDMILPVFDWGNLDPLLLSATELEWDGMERAAILAFNKFPGDAEVARRLAGYGGLG